MLFSEPKIPQAAIAEALAERGVRFSALQRAENSSSRRAAARTGARASVSVLFSEPKIPQGRLCQHVCRSASRFSALQRAENSSRWWRWDRHCTCRGFSALQRAENSSSCEDAQPPPRTAPFQCSSASRKFLKIRRSQARNALQEVSVLFSEPKIPQVLRPISVVFRKDGFSALQRAENSSRPWTLFVPLLLLGFSALQRAENSSRSRCRSQGNTWRTVSVLFSEPKIPQAASRGIRRYVRTVSVLFSEPKIPQARQARPRPAPGRRFQCSSASRKFLKCSARVAGVTHRLRFSALQRAENSSRFRTWCPGWST